MAPRIFLLLLTNFAIMTVLSLALSITGIGQQAGLSGLLMTCFVFGMGGAVLSLLISRPMARWSMRVNLLTGGESEEASWLVATVKALASQARIAMPQVGIFPGAPNAFATGPSKNSAMVAVSTELLRTMPRDQVKAVLAHEIGHVANGDMVTLTLVQGVMNTFVMFVSRVVGAFIDKAVLKNESSRGLGYMLTVFVLDLVFGALAGLVVAKVSRWREFRADAAAAQSMGGPDAMIGALQSLAQRTPEPLSPSLAGFGVNGKAGAFFSLWASHPPIPVRIAALERQR